MRFAGSFRVLILVGLGAVGVVVMVATGAIGVGDGNGALEAGGSREAPAGETRATAASLDTLSQPSRWLRDYLRIDTTNPPGNEAQAASYLGDILRREGIATRLLVTPQGRANLYARLKASPAGGAVSNGALVLLHHMDVVPSGDGWSVDPFTGTVKKGRLWGRGAIDAKSLGIAQLVAFLELKRQQVPLSWDVVFLAVADEERGGTHGVQWLLETYPELFADVRAVLNEGGSNKIIGERLMWWGVEVAQKRPLWIRVTARGRAGHGSGLNPHSATHQLLQGLARVLDLPSTYRVTPASQMYFRALASFHGEPFRRVFDEEDVETVQARIDSLKAREELHRVLLPGMPVFFIDTVQVTSIDTGGTAINVVPDVASALVDIRLLPDTDGDRFLSQLREALGKHLSVEVLLSSRPVAPSPVDTPTYRTMQNVLGVRAPVVPAFITGTTDSRYFRERGIPAYGFAPFALTGQESLGIHGPDESIPLAKFDEGVETMRRLVFACATQ